MLSFQDSLEMSNFSNEISPKERKKIIDNYQIQQKLDDDRLGLEQINAVIQQALWVGFCRGKGWD